MAATVRWFVQLLEQRARAMAQARRSPRETFGQRVARLRRARGLTQAELGQQVGLSRRMVAYYEGQTDRPPAYVLDRLVAVLQVSADQLLGLRPVAVEAPTRSRLWRRLRVVEELPASDRKTVLTLIEALAARQRVAPRG